MFLLSDLPIPSPRGSMDIPEPTVKKLMPIISITVPSINVTSTPVSRGIHVTERIKTISAIGITEPKASLNDEKICPIILLLPEKLSDNAKYNQ